MKTLTDLWLEGRKKLKSVIEDNPEEKPVKKTTRKSQPPRRTQKRKVNNNGLSGKTDQITYE